MKAADETPAHLREGVKAGILASIRLDTEHRGGRTARLLVAAGFLGVIGAVGVTLLVSRHPYDHHPPWHLAVFSAAWAGVLVVVLAIALLRLRTPALPLSHAAAVGILGLALAGICGAICPDQHFLHWWTGTAVGSVAAGAGGPALSALCFGLVATMGIGAASALLLIGRDRTSGLSMGPTLPAAILLLLLTPGIALQSFDTSWGVFAAWIAGAGLGAWLGIAAIARARALLAGEG